ncbi:MAG TPA: hypothetical protein VMQ52_02550 [Candidatus Saccharimonadales bacterium]|jgi:hypothetical protein|nr:hypothetical protein [Candidatus Saccharimonadales bacterium]
MSNQKKSLIEKVGIGLTVTALSAGTYVGLSAETPAPRVTHTIDAATRYSKEGVDLVDVKVLPGSTLWNIGAAVLRAEGVPATTANINATAHTLEYPSGTAANAGYVQAGQEFRFGTTRQISKLAELKTSSSDLQEVSNNKT